MNPADYRKQKAGKSFPGDIPRSLKIAMMERPKKPIRVFSWHFISTKVANKYRKEVNKRRNKRFRQSMTKLEYKLIGTLDRGDGEPDLEWEPPLCPNNCGGDAYIKSPSLDPENQVWKCSDCDGIWDGYAEEL